MQRQIENRNDLLHRREIIDSFITKPFLITSHGDVVRRDCQRFPIEIAFWESRGDICEPHQTSHRGCTVKPMRLIEGINRRVNLLPAY